MEYETKTRPGPIEGTTVTTIKKKEDAKKMVKKVLPWVVVGLGAVLLIIALKMWYDKRQADAAAATAGKSAAYVALAPLADPNYGTATLSGIPAVAQYQSRFAPTPAVQAIQQNPEMMGLTYQGANMPVPVSILANGRNMYMDCQENACSGRVGCTDSSMANYDPTATCGCINCCVPKTIGCLDPTATTYNPFANTNDSRFCKYATAPAAMAVLPAQAMDCATQLQMNPHSSTCVAPIGGCTDMNNAMFSPTATYNNGTCVYGGNLVLPAMQENVGCGSQMAAVLGAAAGVMDTGGCVPKYQDQYTGGFRGCGDAWTLGNGNGLGATMYQ